MKKTKLYFELFIQLVIGYSLVTYFIELEFSKTENSLEGHSFFLWSERAVATIFTIEYLIRWLLAAKPRILYPFRPMAIIDLVAIIPFYVGFMVDMRSLRLIRTLRMLRVLKAYRYNTALRTLMTSYGRVKDELYLLGGVILLIMFFSGTIVYEAERNVQPDKFVNYSDGLWWSVVTLTTVGYGDMYPVTTTGKLTACVTLLIGLGVFGSFISLLGGSYISTMREEKRLKEIRISQHAQDHIVQMLELIGHQINEDEANRLIESALDLLTLYQNGKAGDFAADCGIPMVKD